MKIAFVTRVAPLALIAALAVPSHATGVILRPRHPSATPARTPRPSLHIDPAVFNAPLQATTTVDGFIEAIPDWTKVGSRLHKKDKNDATDGGKSTEKKDDRTYNVTKTKYSLTETPEEIVTYQPVNGFWLGSLTQERGLREGLGSMVEIAVPAEKRAPFKISSDLPMEQNYVTIAFPSATTVSSAIGSLQNSGNKSGWGGARTLKIVDNFSEEQTAHDLGISGSYMGASVKASLSANRYDKKHTITASFIEKAFTVQADFEGRSRRAAFFKDNFTIDDAHELVKEDRIGMTNLPTYIKSITYGRVVLFNLTSTLSEEEMKTAVDASYEGFGAKAQGSYKSDSKSKNAEFELRVTEFGGLQSGFSKLVPAKGIENVFAVMNSYLKQNAPLTSMRPISYTADTLRDDQLASMAVTTNYTVTKYAANAIGDHLKIKMWVDVTGSNDGVADNTMECYGNLRVNGDVWWEIPRSEATLDANKREAGQALAISEDGQHAKKDFTFDYYYADKTPFNFQLNLIDSDSGSKDDTFGSFGMGGVIALPMFPNLLASGAINGPGEWTLKWDSGQGESSTLHIKAERIDYL